MPKQTPITKQLSGRKKPTQLKNYVAIVLDESGSMEFLATSAVRVYNDIVDTLSKETNRTGQETLVSSYKFANRVKRLDYNSEPQLASKLFFNAYNGFSEPYCPNGGTALWDGVGTAIEDLKKVADADDPNTSFLLLVITDGEENQSRTFRLDSIKRSIADLQSTDRWSFVFQVPPGRYAQQLATFGIPTDNIREWAGTKVGIETAGNQITRGLSNYYGARSKGATKSTSFFVETDLSKVTTKDVKAKLDDISNRFKAYTMTTEQVVKDFVEAKTKKEYVIGQAYFQLMKPEKVQTTKAVLIQEKGKKAIWGGKAARDLIGLPAHTDAKVTPGNHSNFDIFVQSTSVNRKLPRGTKLLIDMQQTQSMAPTWDHTAVSQAVS